MGGEIKQSASAAPTDVHGGPRLELRFEAPFSAFDGKQSDIKCMSVPAVSSAYYSVDSLSKKISLYEGRPGRGWARVKNIVLRLPAQILAGYAGHELAHLKLTPLGGERNRVDPPFYRAATFSAGREHDMSHANRLTDDLSMYGRDYSAALFYLLLKVDSYLHIYDFKFSISPWSRSENDRVGLRREIAFERTGVYNDDDLIEDGDAGFSDMVTVFGVLFHFLDPVFLWSFYQVGGGDGSPPPFYLPQFHYHETPYGPAFIVRGRIPLETGHATGLASSMMTIGALATYNDYREESCGYEVGFKELAIPGTPLKFDAAHKGLVSPDVGYIADVEGIVRIPIFGAFSLVLGGRHKFGDGYLVGSQFFRGASVVVGFSLRRDAFE